MKTKTINMAGKAGLVGIVLIILTGLVSAGFSVQSFNCNSQSGTIVVGNGGTLSCQATVKNTGSSAANLTTVTLFMDGTWAESTSYTGIGFSTTVQAGSTVTATFGNIKPTTSGLHGFNYILINSVTDDYPTSSTVNVVSIRSTTVNAPDQNPEGTEFTISASVTSGGNADITLNISLSGCSLATGEVATRSLGTVSDNTVKSASWSVVQGSTTCSFNITATGSSAAVTVSKVKSDSVLVGTAATTTTTSTTTTIPLTVNLTLNEFMPNPPSGEEEWIEIYNAGNVAVNLTGWRLDDETGASTPYVLPGENISIGGFKIYYGNVTSLDLGDTKDSVRLLNTTLGLIDSYSWTSLIPSNTSMMRTVDGSGSWIQSNSSYPSTPGSSNVGLVRIGLTLGWNLISIPLLV